MRQVSFLLLILATFSLSYDARAMFGNRHQYTLPDDIGGNTDKEPLKTSNPPPATALSATPPNAKTSEELAQGYMTLSPSFTSRGRSQTLGPLSRATAVGTNPSSMPLPPQPSLIQDARDIKKTQNPRGALLSTQQTKVLPIPPLVPSKLDKMGTDFRVGSAPHVHDYRRQITRFIPIILPATTPIPQKPSLSFSERMRSDEEHENNDKEDFGIESSDKESEEAQYNGVQDDASLTRKNSAKDSDLGDNPVGNLEL